MYSTNSQTENKKIMSKLIFSLITFLIIATGIIKAQINPTDSPYYFDGSYVVESDSNMTAISVPLLFYRPQATGTYPVLMFQLGANGFGSNVINRHTYDLFMYHLASYGFVVIIIDDSQAGFPNGTSFKAAHDWFTANIANSGHWLSSYADGSKLVIGGHSNGGVNASALLVDRPTEIDGIVFMDSYPSTGILGIGAHDVSGYTGKEMTLSAGENDPTANKNGYDSFTSTDCKTYVNISGLDHGGFGDYILASQPVGSIGRINATASIRHYLVSWMLSEFKADSQASNELMSLALRPNTVGEFLNDCGTLSNSLEESDYSINLYPNPTKDFINVNMPIVGATLEIYNSIGQHIFTAKNNGGNMVIDLSSFPDGLYLLGVNNAQGIQINCSKIIKN